MADRTRALIIGVLTVAIIGVASATVGSLYGRRCADLRARIDRYREMILEAERRSPATENRSTVSLELRAIEAEREKYYLPGEMTLSRFAEMIERELRETGMRVIRYRPVESAAGVGSRHFAEFVVDGDAKAFFSFLRAGSTSPRYRYVQSVSVKAAGEAGNVEVTLRVGYEELAPETDN
ncbi:MAG TPA: hypothetical protein VMW87_11585 [Spirochaetia bacterium]|nr:hypothetical protein [Spirochaetia bacterium]